MRLTLHEHYYVTRPHDTLRTVALRCYGQANPKLLARIIAWNQHNPTFHHITIITSQTVLPLYEVILLPQPYCKQRTTRAITNTINHRPQQQKHLFAQCIQANLSLPHIAAVCYMREHLIQLAGDAAIGVGVASLIGEKFADHWREKATDFHQSMQTVDQHLQALVKAPSPEKPLHRQRFKESYHNMSHQFRTQIDKLVAKHYHGKKAHFLHSEERLWNLARSRRHGFSLLDREEAKVVLRHVQQAKWIARSCIAFDLGLRSWDVITAYQQHRDWQQELIEEIGGLLTASLFSSAAIIPVELILGPIGWMAIVLGSAGGIVGDYVGRHLIKKLWQFS